MKITGRPLPETSTLYEVGLNEVAGATCAGVVGVGAGALL
jgi:hypothetical protein